MKATGVFIALLLVSVEQVANAASWVKASDNSESQAFIDAESLVWNGDRVTFWLKVVWKKVTVSRRVMALYQFEIACGARQLRSLAGTNYDASGDPIRPNPGIDPTFTPIAPETIGDTVREALCMNQPK